MRLKQFLKKTRKWIRVGYQDNFWPVFHFPNTTVLSFNMAGIFYKFNFLCTLMYSTLLQTSFQRTTESIYFLLIIFFWQDPSSRHPRVECIFRMVWRLLHIVPPTWVSNSSWPSWGLGNWILSRSRPFGRIHTSQRRCCRQSLFSQFLALAFRGCWAFRLALLRLSFFTFLVGAGRWNELLARSMLFWWLWWCLVLAIVLVFAVNYQG